VPADAIPLCNAHGVAENGASIVRLPSPDKVDGSEIDAVPFASLPPTIEKVTAVPAGFGVKVAQTDAMFAGGTLFGKPWRRTTAAIATETAVATNDALVFALSL
jgi:hypothetical protein